MSAPQRRNVRGTRTRERLYVGALETLSADGYAGATARGVAARSDASQASIFYHFDSVDDLLLEAVGWSSERRLERYRERMDALTSIPEVMTTWRELHAEDVSVGHASALNALIAAAGHNDELGAQLLAVLEPWRAYVRETVTRVIDGSALGALIDPELASTTIVALFLGVEVLSRLDGEDLAEPLFTQADRLAALGRFLGT